jgi:hypothetical protein
VNNLPDAQLLRDSLSYDPQTGSLFWKERPLEIAGNQNEAKRWNAKHAGREVGAAVSVRGYKKVRVLGFQYTQHRVIWKLVYGTDPYYIDHINGNRSDNRLANLRNVSFQDNCRNRRMLDRNTSGVTGVCWARKKKAWQASIADRGKTIYLGLFKSIQDAADARSAAERELGYHENHGQ